MKPLKTKRPLSLIQTISTHCPHFKIMTCEASEQPVHTKATHP